MTLVAAFRQRGIPMLLGDFLLTSPQGLAGVRKKIHRLRPNLAIGWTNSRLAATIVVSALNRQLQDGPARKVRCEEFLRSFDVSTFQPQAVQLVGWIVDGHAECFTWHSDFPQEVTYLPSCILGSGAGAGEAMPGIGRDPRGGAEDPIKRTLAAASRLMSDEFGQKAFRGEGFGFGYELLTLSHGEFRYVTNILYVAVEAEFDASGKFIGARVHPSFFNYHHIDPDFAVIQRTTVLVQGKTTFDWPGRANLGRDVVRYVITPVYDVAKAEVDALVARVGPLSYSIPLDAEYSCLFASIIRDADTSAAQPLTSLVHVASVNDVRRLFSVTEEPANHDSPAGSFAVRLPPTAFFEIAYRDAIHR